MKKELEPVALSVVKRSSYFSPKHHNAAKVNERIVRIHYAGVKYAEDYKIKIGTPKDMFKSLINEVKYYNSVRKACDCCKDSAMLNPSSLNKAEALEFLEKVAKEIKSRK